LLQLDVEAVLLGVRQDGQRVVDVDRRVGPIR